ncbi:glycosyltransferase [Tautonia plasticadhaerens]|uniref:N-acetylgalactosamine-N, N'-diacetylbacillosaminyl-diphospho-undecaprenol 4-alpha-N-acetylgalactosaminyltransferase n=1 Tax=Tautonia plasticadhaerens TaxID=2527974 RepID=A0A518H4K0_9BACT|nr:glycosyltransferase [Tautonia plasticadhaerens]QDV35764.1 N-acetylgalactosamine-N,N'-diacetylbacillosaminyl-diphospho-undecaprenol 4-alpha-N-acetylgalactosaminyltransferase [Tautonia plasticadhaerens]
MRLGVDLLPLQSGGSRDRGVGRYAAELLRSLAGHRPGDEFVLYRCRDLPSDRVPPIDGRRVRSVEIGRDEEDDTIRGRLARIAAHNPDGLDALLLLNPFELSPGFEPPPRVPGGVPIVAVLYDLIPLLFPGSYLGDPGVRRRYGRRLDAIRHYDRFLAISGSTRRDAISRLGLRGDRVAALPFALDPDFRPADPGGGDEGPDGVALGRVGVSGPFVLHVGGRDDRKNVWGVIDAFAGLGPEAPESSTLVLVGDFGAAYQGRISAYAADRGVSDQVAILGVVDDGTLKTLYRRCSAFVFPSLYEGLGLPLLEAMRSGAAVIGGRNSSQCDLVGDAGLLVDPGDSAGLRSALGRLLEDPALATSMGKKALDRTAGLSWDDVGREARSAILGAIGGRTPRPHLRIGPDRPRVGLVSPLPPKETGIADYAARLAGALLDHASVDLYHDGDYVPELGLRDRRFRCVDRAAFARRVEVLPHRAVVYQMGNSWYHRSVYELLREHPGITVLHDFNLSGFHFWYGHQPDVRPGHFDRVVEAEREAGAIGPDEDVEAWRSEPGGIQGAATRRGVHMNREIFERSRFVVVHSPYCRDLVRAALPEYLDRTVVVPMGASIDVPGPGQVAETRRRFGIPGDAVVFGCFGNLTSMKMYEEAIRAFADVLGRVDRALLLFVGKDWEGGRALALARESGVGDRTLFLGKASREDYGRLVGSVDVGLGLRRPPTYGETSASLLDFLRCGVATIVTDVATFRDYPPSAVVRWDPVRDGEDGLADRMVALARDESRRRAIADAAVDHVRKHHDWKIAARAYADLIERCAPGEAVGRFAGSPGAGGTST